MGITGLKGLLSFGRKEEWGVGKVGMSVRDCTDGAGMRYSGTERKEGREGKR